MPLRQLVVEMIALSLTPFPQEQEARKKAKKKEKKKAAKAKKKDTQESPADLPPVAEPEVTAPKPNPNTAKASSNGIHESEAKRSSDKVANGKNTKHAASQDQAAVVVDRKGVTVEDLLRKAVPQTCPHPAP